MGFAVPRTLPPARWALTPPFHPYPRRERLGRFRVFCGTFLEVSLTGRYPASCPAEPGLSSRRFRAERLPEPLRRAKPSTTRAALRLVATCCADEGGRRVPPRFRLRSGRRASRRS